MGESNFSRSNQIFVDCSCAETEVSERLELLERASFCHWAGLAANRVFQRQTSLTIMQSSFLNKHIDKSQPQSDISQGPLPHQKNKPRVKLPYRTGEHICCVALPFGSVPSEESFRLPYHDVNELCGAKSRRKRLNLPQNTPVLESLVSGQN